MAYHIPLHVMPDLFRASTTLLQSLKTFMAGTSPAMNVDGDEA
jgi:hypothetical protein